MTDLETRLRDTNAALEDKSNRLAELQSSLNERTASLQAERDKEVIREKERATFEIAELQARYEDAIASWVHIAYSYFFSSLSDTTGREKTGPTIRRDPYDSFRIGWRPSTTRTRTCSNRSTGIRPLSVDKRNRLRRYSFLDGEHHSFISSQFRSRA